MSRPATLGAAGLTLALLTLTHQSRADEVFHTQHGDDGYEYVFPDDPLAGNDRAAQAALIRVAPRAMRRTLIRPRLHFIPELLKSVEQL
ncbi:MAG: hypothetical protein KC731_16440 [Myxococcales bacterium]|nr:hypothetical protein [Myxococcales bacterium]